MRWADLPKYWPGEELPLEPSRPNLEKNPLLGSGKESTELRERKERNNTLGVRYLTRRSAASTQSFRSLVGLRENTLIKFLRGRTYVLRLVLENAGVAGA